ncbi:MAG: hypothetical protein OXQ29_04110, partial [Rhodospirillaceae bacterium]|nr:hypothetical protein [Rhodospirillaceae bacterium]
FGPCGWVAMQATAAAAYRLRARSKTHTVAIVAVMRHLTGSTNALVCFENRNETRRWLWMARTTCGGHRKPEILQ